MWTVAAEYGISDVALAKICKKLDVPRPGIGFWNRVAHGQSLRRAALPPRQRGVPAAAEVYGASKAAPPTPPGPKPAYPNIPVPETLSHPHPTVRRIRTELDGQKIHNGALALSAGRDTVVRVTPACRNRALILFDALAKALAERGHELVFGLKHELRSTPYSLAACFPHRWREPAATAGNGLRKLVTGAEDLQEAVVLCNNSLLSQRPLTAAQIQIVGQRVLTFAVAPLEQMA
jgi:hypothetical protein